MEMKLEDLLKAKGISQKELEKLLKPRVPAVKVIQPRKTKTYKFGMISDTHLVDTACALSELADFYRRCQAEGVTEVVNAGDIASGMSVFKGQINELVCYGFDAHLDYIVKSYPRIEGITTYFIGGNHDENYQQVFGAGIGEHIAMQRPDMIYLGMYDATVVLNGVKIGLHHGARGVPYSISYHLQKYIEKIGAGQKPQIYCLGHYHATLYMFYRNIHCFLPGCWQKPNNFSVRLGLPNQIGGWIIEIEVADNARHSITSIKSEFIPYY